MKYLVKFNESIDNIDIIMQNLEDICLELKDIGYSILIKVGFLTRDTCNETNYRFDMNVLQLTKKDDNGIRSLFEPNQQEIIETTLRILDYLNSNKYYTSINTPYYKKSTIRMNRIEKDGFYYLENSTKKKVDYEVRFINIHFSKKIFFND